MGLGKSKILSQAAATAAGSNFEPYIWTGNATERSVTGVGIAADMLWFKSRTQGNYNPKIIDTVRGLNGGTVMENLYTSLSNAQANDNGFRSLDADGFSVADSGDGNNDTINYVGWFFKGGGSSNIYNVDGTGYSTSAAAGLASGSIAPSGASVNTAGGFSIVEYAGTQASGATVAHGLSSAPEMIIAKRIDYAEDWVVYHSSVGNTKTLNLNNTDGEVTDSAFNNTTPSSTVFTLDNCASGSCINSNSGSYIAYCFTSITGYQKIGSYTGNSSSSHSISTGFQPRFVMMKNTSSGYSWIMQDSVRGTGVILYANLASADVSTSTHITSFDSNGFTLGSNADVNYSGDTYIYLAIA